MAFGNLGVWREVRGVICRVMRTFYRPEEKPKGGSTRQPVRIAGDKWICAHTCGTVVTSALLPGIAKDRHAESMANEFSPPSDQQRFGAGLTEVEVRRFQAILREKCGLDVGLPEAWARAIELLSLVETLLQSNDVIGVDRHQSAEFALPRS